MSAAHHPHASGLDELGDRPFLEPSLFAYLVHPDTPLTLDQVLYGSLPGALRPDRFEARVDDDGVVFLPGLGRLVCDTRASLVTVTSAASDADLRIEAGGARVGGAFEGLRRAERSDIEISTRVDPLLEWILGQTTASLGPFGTEALARMSTESIERALQILQVASPSLHASLLAVTRRIVLFDAGECESFAAPAAHGAVFLRPPPGADEVFFIEDLCHQCGHLLFGALTVDRDELFTLDPDSPLSALTGDPHEHRTVYVTLHGVFTESLMSIALFQCLSTEIFEGRQRHELAGRLSFIMKRMHLDLAHLRHRGLFTERGLAWRRACERVFDEVFRLAREAITDFDLRNQPYAFQYGRFLDLNPDVGEAPGVRQARGAARTTPPSGR